MPGCAPTHLCIATLYTSEIASLAERTNPSKFAYCQRWGYVFECHAGTLDPSRPPAWSKLRIVRNLLDRYQWVFWLDADALIMNPEVRAETLLDDRYNLILAKQPGPDPWGNHHLNTGSFFIKSDKWSKRLLDDWYDQIQFIDHPGWEQEAFLHLYRQRDDVRDRVKVCADARKMNAIVSSYGKGDFVFHALGLRRTEQNKLALVEETIRTDARIPESIQPEIEVLLFHYDEEESALLECTLPSLLLDKSGIARNRIRFVKAFERSFAETYGWEEIHHYWFDNICKALEASSEDIVVIARPGSLFFPGWERRILAALGPSDLAIATDAAGQPMPDDVIVLRRNAACLRLLQSCRQDFVQQPLTIRRSVDARRRMLIGQLAANETVACPSWSTLPPGLVHIGPAAGLSRFALIGSAILSPGDWPDAQRRAELRTVLAECRTLIDHLRQTVFDAGNRRVMGAVARGGMIRVVRNWLNAIRRRRAGGDLA